MADFNILREVDTESLIREGWALRFFHSEQNNKRHAGASPWDPKPGGLSGAILQGMWSYFFVLWFPPMPRILFGALISRTNLILERGENIARCPIERAKDAVGIAAGHGQGIPSKAGEVLHPVPASIP